jgi:hypothetical protein
VKNVTDIGEEQEQIVPYVYMCVLTANPPIYSMISSGLLQQNLHWPNLYPYGGTIFSTEENPNEKNRLSSSDI